MGYHIKRDGQYLCKAKIRRNGSILTYHIKFAEAHKSELKECCEDCKKRYYEIVSKLKEPIII